MATATLFHMPKGWFVSVRTATGFQHIKVAGPSTYRQGAVESARDKGFQVQ